MTRRLVARGAIAFALLAYPAAAAATAGASTQSAHSAAKTATSIIHTTVPAKGKYLLTVDVRSRGKHARVVEVYLPGQPMRTVTANPWWGAALYYRLTLSQTKLVVRTVNAPPAVAVRATLSLRKAAKSTTSGSPTTNTAPPAKSTTPPTSGGTTTTTTTTPPPPPPSSSPCNVGSPKFCDDFQSDFTSGGSAPYQLPAASKWTLDNWGGCGPPTASNPYGTMSQSNTNVAGESSYNLDGVNPATNASLTSNGLAITAVPIPGSHNYVSAQIDSAGHFSGQYGTVEASIEMPPGQGLCPGFWMLGDGNIPGSSIPGEIDIVEAPSFVGGMGTQYYFDLHGLPVNGTTQQYSTSTPVNLVGFHTFAITWTPTQIVWTIDGNPYAVANQNALVAGASWAQGFDYGNFHLIFDLAVGGWPCDPNPSGCPPVVSPAPATMYIQWVKWLP
jgi:hypothetical protein